MSDELMRSLDERLDESAGDELTFAEWFARWDSGPRAVIIDRLSLYRAWVGAEVGVQSEPLGGEARGHFARDARTTRPGAGGVSERTC